MYRFYSDLICQEIKQIVIACILRNSRAFMMDFIIKEISQLDFNISNFAFQRILTFINILIVWIEFTSSVNFSFQM